MGEKRGGGDTSLSREGGGAEGAGRREGVPREVVPREVVPPRDPRQGVPNRPSAAEGERPQGGRRHSRSRERELSRGGGGVEEHPTGVARSGSQTYPASPSTRRPTSGDGAHQIMDSNAGAAASVGVRGGVGGGGGARDPRGRGGKEDAREVGRGGGGGDVAGPSAAVPEPPSPPWLGTFL